MDLVYNRRLMQWQATDIPLPNVKQFFVPDPGYILFDVDLAGADAQVVAWEANDAPLKNAFRAYAAGEGPKVHCVNSIAIFGDKAGPSGKAMPYYHYAKMGVHLTNYGGQANTCAMSLKISKYEAEKFQDKWFEEHPDIYAWHERTKEGLMRDRQVHNAFGYSRTYFERYSMSILQQALAWGPQSTVALVINKALVRITRELPQVQLLLQVHDSLVGQVHQSQWKRVKPLLRELLLVTIPYPDPLIIPAGLKTSLVSWGHCKDEAWDS